MRPNRLALALLVVVACDSGGDAPRAEPKPTSTTPVPEPAPAVAKTDVGSRSTFELGTKEAALETKAKIAEHLAAGRKAVKAKDYATGIHELGEAKALSPTNAKVLGELGWAYFLDGQLGPAQRELERALHNTAKSNTKGAVLYNLGRVHEARGNADVAAELYARSLDARPGNAVVQSRLDALAKPDLRARTQCAFEKQPTAPPKSLCEDYLSRWQSEGEDAPICQFGGPQSGLSEVLEAGAFRVELFSIHDYDLMEETFVLAVVMGDTWYTDEWLVVSHPGVGYADENLDDVSLESRTLIPGGEPEVVIRFRVGQHDMDPGVLQMADSVAESLGVIAIDSGKPRWMATVRTHAEWSQGRMDPDEWGAMIDPETGTSSAEVVFDEKGALTVAAKGSSAPTSTAVGTFELGRYPVVCPVEQDYFGI